jgi:hypothetical protein
VKALWRKQLSGNPGILWVWLFLFLGVCSAARANVYATDIRFNGSLQAGVVVPGNPVTISFILNDNAANVFVEIYASSRTIKVLAAGTNAGLNTVVWDGTNNDGTAAAVGAYNVRITAAAFGYNEWTNITDDGTNFDVFYPTGIAVNINTNSPYYGRVFIGNSENGGGAISGIFKCNADGSPADEGGFSTGGYPWGGGGYPAPSPWMMDVGADDRLYVDDWSANGLVLSFDEVLSTNYFNVLRSDNYPYPDVLLSGPWVCGEGTNMQIFMADINTTNAFEPGLGILSWTLSANGVIATNDIGTVQVTLTNNSDLTLAPDAVSVGANGDIFTIQRVEFTNDQNPRVLCFPPPPSGGPPDTTAIWDLGSNEPTLVNVFGVAVDPAETFVAVASRGYGPDAESLQNGGVSIFRAIDGSLVTNITEDPEGFTNQEIIDVAWDNVGNLYATYNEDFFSQSGWRVYSPPGLNQATTVAVPIIQVYKVLTPPQLSQASCDVGQLNFIFTGQSNITYVIQQSTDLINWTAIATNFSPTAVLPVSVSPPDTQDFYRAVIAP